MKTNLLREQFTVNPNSMNSRPLARDRNEWRRIVLGAKVATDCGAGDEEFTVSFNCHNQQQ
jgi:hypothetical protein